MDEGTVLALLLVHKDLNVIHQETDLGIRKLETFQKTIPAIILPEIKDVLFVATVTTSPQIAEISEMMQATLSKSYPLWVPVMFAPATSRCACITPQFTACTDLLMAFFAKIKINNYQGLTKYVKRVLLNQGKRGHFHQRKLLRRDRTPLSPILR